MQLSEQWIKSWLPKAQRLSTQQLVDALTHMGIEVDDLHVDAGSDDKVYTLKTPANRGDCLSVQGIARELAACLSLKIHPPFESDALSPVSTKKQNAAPLSVTIEKKADNDCPLYMAAVISDLRQDAVTPDWMLHRLQQSGVGSHGIIVDIVNYVMFELGQPMHAFDRQALSDTIVVRHAKTGEKLALLNDTTVELKPGTLVIADAKGPQAIAGIMGGLSSAVTERTTDIVLESAYFNPISVRLAARNYGLRTDSAQRFERGVDPEAVKIALARAVDLFQTLAGGKMTAWVSLQSKDSFPTARVISLSSTECQKVLGISFAPKVIDDYLHRLGCEAISKQAESWEVKVPSFRQDIQLSIDIVEELGRLHGLDKIPSVLPDVVLTPPVFNKSLHREQKLQQGLAARGYQEVITYSFIDPALAEAWSGTKPSLVLLNPISSEMSAMRESLLPGLLTTLQHFQRNSGADSNAAFFEVGRCFSGISPAKASQNKHLAGIVTGSVWDSAWGLKSIPQDFFSLKKTAEALWQNCVGRVGKVTFVKGSHPAFHPSEHADVLLEGKAIGVLGALHPRLYAAFDCAGPVIAFECFDIEALPEEKVVQFKPFSRFPVVTRDLALLVPLELSAQQVKDEIARVVQAPWIFHQTIFDVYQGEKLGKQKSLGVKLSLQHPDRTLKDEEVNALIAKILQHLHQVFDIQLRQ